MTSPRVAHFRTPRTAGVRHDQRRDVAPHPPDVSGGVNPLRRLVAPLVLVATTTAFAACPEASAPLRLPDACVGDATAGSVSFCFGPDCLDTGVVLGMTPPAAPFAVTAVHID